ncbi:MAG TPA: GGDEF domain-containing protein [Tepidisphaeraceae bacterium]|nr:GGDEF domain-containing protein [Tepidisphaeraceae bacterium]
MKWLFPSRSLQLQLLLLGVVSCVLGALMAWLMLCLSPTGEPTLSPGDVSSAMGLAGLTAVSFFVLNATHLLKPLSINKTEQELSRQALSERTQTVDRLLDFSQEIQGAGKAEQIFESLAYFLRTELKLSGIVIASLEPESAVQLKVAWPLELDKGDTTLTEMDSAMCPCLRQNLPRCFKPDASPLRCTIDRALSLPADHPAYCIPFTIGRKMQCIVHMLLPPKSEWTEHLRQLAATYVNTACSSLTSLNLLAEAEQRSMTDPLTQLYNRRSLDQLLQREVSLAERYGHPLSLVMIDMDKFKQVNDTHGHAAGDHMLRSFADCVRITLRRTDLAFRYGGDEFVIALPQTPLSQAQQVVQKLRQAFLAVDFSHAITHLEHQPTLSIGVAERSKNGNVLTLGALLAAADEALYEAKNTSRNCVRIYEPQRAA